MGEKETHRDRELVNRVLSGDREAFEALDQQYRPVAYQAALKVVGDTFEADDVVQEAMLRAYTRLVQLSNPTQFGPWLAAIVRSVSIDHLRARTKSRNRIRYFDELPEATFTDIPVENSNPLRRLQMEESFHQQISVLSSPLAEVVRLRYIDGLHLSEIAIELQVPLGTVKRRFHDARKQMRRRAMKTFDERVARSIVDAAGRELAELPRDISEDIIGVAVGGDLVRGDFIPNNSSLLVFPLFSNRSTLYMYDTPAYRAITEIFGRLCSPYNDCAEAPSVWQNLAFDEVHLPSSAERFNPPTTPQPQWHSLFLFDLIDHHCTIYGKDYIEDLYRPNPRNLTLQMAAEVLRVSRTGATSHPAGFGCVAHWQALKLVRVLQLHFSPGDPTIAWKPALTNYRQHVPDFASKGFGEKIWEREMAARYPTDRKLPSSAHVARCQEFVEDACDLLTAMRQAAIG